MQETPQYGDQDVERVEPQGETDLEQRLAQAEQAAQENRELWLRAKADCDNLKKRSQTEIANAHKFAVENFATELLAVKDSLEAALASEGGSTESMRSGVELTLKQLASAFDKVKLVEIDPKGEKFDPHKHQAMSMVDGPEPPNTVAQVFQKGYLLADRVLRPAMVAVTKPKDEAA